jgi:hypothetical protein
MKVQRMYYVHRLHQPRCAQVTRRYLIAQHVLRTSNTALEVRPCASGTQSTISCSDYRQQCTTAAETAAIASSVGPIQLDSGTMLSLSTSQHDSRHHLVETFLEVRLAAQAARTPTVACLFAMRTI